jgi:hypothetical protein
MRRCSRQSAECSAAWDFPDCDDTTVVTRMKIVYIVALAALCTTIMVVPTFAQTTSSAKEATMTARGPFDVKITPQDDKLNDGISRMLIDKQYHGDLEGTSKGQMLAVGSAKSSGVYVAIETFTGTLQGRTGSFSLHHTGIMTKTGPSLSVSVVPDSGTGQLAGISGKMNIIIAPDGKHSYEFDYTLPDQK